MGKVCVRSGLPAPVLGVIALLCTELAFARIAESGAPAEKSRMSEAPGLRVELPEITVRARREPPRQEPLRSRLEKAMRPTDRPANHDLNQASAGMRAMAGKMADFDTDRRLPGGAYAPPASFGEPADRCGADLSKGCN